MGTGDQKIEGRERKYHAKMARAIARKGETLLDLDDHMNDPREPGARYTELRLKLDSGDDADVLAILKRETGEGKEIAFHYGQSVSAALEGLAGRLKNGSLKWREDTPYERG